MRKGLILTITCIAVLNFGFAQGFYQQYIDSVVNTFEDADSDEELIDLYKHGLPYLMEISPDTVIHFATKGGVLATKLGDKKSKVWFVGIIGDSYSQLGQYAHALEYLIDASEMAEVMQDTSEWAYMLNSTGSVYRASGNWDDAERLYKQALELRRLQKDTAGMASVYNNIGIVNMLRADYDIGMEQWGKSLELKEAMGDSLGAATTMSNMAMYYRDIGETELALDYLNRAGKIKAEAGDLVGESLVYDNLGELYMKLGEFEKAEEYYIRALEIIEMTKSNHYISAAYQHLSTFYKHSGDFEKALTNLEIHQELEAEIINESTLNDMSAIKAEHQAEKDRMLIEKLEMEAAMDEAESAKEQIFKIALILVLIVVLIFAGFAVWKFIQKKRDNEIISEQKSEVEEQKKQVELQKDILFEKNREILDSINYARRLQNAILPDPEDFNGTFESGFILYMPKDIIAGDFYWMQKVGKKVFFAVADCTGHGVPGALVSVVCSNALNRAIKEFNLQIPGEILTKTSELVEGSFVNREDEVKDGMDIALCCLDQASGELLYSGANNNLYLIAKGELVEYKAAKQPVGAFDYKSDFITHRIDYQEGDTIYLFSDGYADQFGGPKGKKMKYSNFKNLLIENVMLDMNRQRDFFQESIELWRGDLEQIDDICLMGIRL